MNKSRKEKEGEEYWVTHLMEKKTKKKDYAFSNCPARYIFRSSLAYHHSCKSFFGIIEFSGCDQSSCSKRTGK
jgi:hypothetical protein